MNQYLTEHKNNEKKDRLKSAIITFLVSLVVFLGIYFYKFTKIIPKTQEMVTTMLINFGDNNNGNEPEEPMNQEGSLASNQAVEVPESVKEPKPVPVVEKEKPAAKEKIITGSNPKTAAAKVEKIEKSTSTKVKKETKDVKKSTATTSKSTSTKPASKTNASKTGTGDGKGTAAIGNLLKGRGTKPGSQGDGGTKGNAGDPLGGEGNGDSKIGVDRKLVGFIPGTMGRGGAQPAHSCKASGTISIAYTVDKAGNVVSARRSSGISDPCVVSTSVSWVKKYVKAEKSNSSSTGTYRITF